MTSTKTPTSRRSRSSRWPRPAASSPQLSGSFIDLGALVADWIERTLVHGEGDFLGEPFILDAWERAFVRRLYLVDVETRRRIVRRALMILPKGAGKTELIAAVCLAELAGPTAVDERRRPRTRVSPNIPIAAASYEQSDRLFGSASTMAEHPDSRLRPFVEVLETQIRLKERPGKIYRVAAVAGTNEGGLPTAFGADEIQEWTGRKERVHLILGNSLAKRDQGLELNISTPDDARPNSLLGRLVAYGERVAAGEIADPTFLYVRYSASERWRLDDPKQLRKAIAEATPASWVDPERIAARFEIDHIPEHEFRRYHLAQFVRSAKAWLPARTWERLHADQGAGDGAKVVLGFDGSYARDSTALVGCTLDGHLWVIDAWERPEGPGGEGWIVPRGEVDAAVDRAFRRWHVVEMACDPHRWTTEIQEWAERYGEVVVEFPTNSPRRMSPACARFYAAVVSGEGLTHDGNPALSRHLHNAVVKEHRDGAYITKESRDSPRRIDLAMAAVLGYDRAMWHAAQGSDLGAILIQAGQIGAGSGDEGEKAQPH